MSLKFNHSAQTLYKEIERLYELKEYMTPEEFEKSSVYDKILELKAAAKLLDGYVFKLQGDR